MATTWTVDKLREIRQYPQSNEVLADFLRLAIEDVKRINPTLYERRDDDAEARVDRAVEQLVQIDAFPPEYSGNLDGGVLVNSRNDARNRILSQLVGAGRVVPTTRERYIIPPNVRW